MVLRHAAAAPGAATGPTVPPKAKGEGKYTDPSPPGNTAVAAAPSVTCTTLVPAADSPTLLSPTRRSE